MNTPLWIPSDERKRAAHLTRFIDLVNARYGLADRTYRSLYAWSITHIPEFWAMMWEFGEMRASRGYDAVVDDLGVFPGAKWFAGARLNFAENLLRYRDAQAALIFRDETGRSIRMTYAELYEAVARLAGSLRAVGVRPGDRVCGYMPNLIETAVAMLATTAVGAVWASCATDIGPRPRWTASARSSQRCSSPRMDTFIKESHFPRSTTPPQWPVGSHLSCAWSSPLTP